MIKKKYARRKHVRVATATQESIHSHRIMFNDVPDNETIKLVVDRYFKIASDTLLNGFAWTFPMIDLTVCVHRHPQGINAINKEAQKRTVFNPRRPNEWYYVFSKSEYLKSKKYKFVSNRYFDSKLRDVLFNTNQEFRYSTT